MKSSTRGSEHFHCPKSLVRLEMKFRILNILVLVVVCSTPLAAQDSTVFPYGPVPVAKPNIPLSKAMSRVYDGTYKGVDCFRNELFINFKYTPLKGFDYHGGDGTASRRDSTKVIRANGKYYV